MSAGKVISQLLSRAALLVSPSHAACGSLRWPCNDKVASLAARWDTALLLSPIMKYISSLHLCGITLSFERRIYQEGPHFSVWRGLPPPLVQTQLFPTESNGGSLPGHLVKHPWNMTHNQCGSTQHLHGLKDPSVLLKTWSQSEHRVQFWGHIQGKKMIFLPPDVKKNKQLSVCVLSGYEQRRSLSTTVTTGPWSFRGVCENTHSGSSQAKTPVRWLFVACFVFM